MKRVVTLCLWTGWPQMFMNRWPLFVYEQGDHNYLRTGWSHFVYELGDHNLFMNRVVTLCLWTGWPQFVYEQGGHTLFMNRVTTLCLWTGWRKFNYEQGGHTLKWNKLCSLFIVPLFQLIVIRLFAVVRIYTILNRMYIVKCF